MQRSVVRAEEIELMSRKRTRRKGELRQATFSLRYNAERKTFTEEATETAAERNFGLDEGGRVEL